MNSLQRYNNYLDYGLGKSRKIAKSSIYSKLPYLYDNLEYKKFYYRLLTLKHAIPNSPQQKYVAKKK